MMKSETSQPPLRTGLAGSGSAKAPRYPSDLKDNAGLLLSESDRSVAKTIFRRWRPATLALAIQVFALLLVTLFGVLVTADRALVINWHVFAALQGIAAMCMAIVLRMDAWWRLILLVFPMSLLLMHQLALPPWIYLIGFVLTSGLFWTTFRTQVPFYPSRPDVWRRLAAYLPASEAFRLVDIGSGLGGLVMHLADAKPYAAFLGVEIAPLPWLLSCCRIRFRRLANARFALGNYETLDFADFDMVFAYLSPAAMQALWQKAVVEMQPGSILLSYEFEVPDVQPDTILSMENQPPIYLWRF